MLIWFFFLVKQKTAYERRISDWSSYVCSSDLLPRAAADAPSYWPVWTDSLHGSAHQREWQHRNERSCRHRDRGAATARVASVSAGGYTSVYGARAGNYHIPRARNRSRGRGSAARSAVRENPPTYPEHRRNRQSVEQGKGGL